MAENKAAVVAVDLSTWPKPDYVAHHYPCPDGFGCTVVITDDARKRREPGPVFIKWTHGVKINWSRIRGKNVWITDASPLKAEQLKDICDAKPAFVGIVEHHNNEEARRLEANLPEGWKMYLDKTGVRCASLMLWEGLNPEAASSGLSPPEWLLAINKGDTDLVRKRTDDEIAYHAWITRREVIDSYDNFVTVRDVPVGVATERGRALLIMRRTAAEESLKNVEIHTLSRAKTVEAFGHGAAPIKLGYVKSRGAEWLAAVGKCASELKEPGFDVLCIQWTNEDTGDRQISIRPLKMDAQGKPLIDGSKIARAFGGNGHPPASGVQGRVYLEQQSTVLPLLAIAVAIVAVTISALAYMDTDMDGYYNQRWLDANPSIKCPPGKDGPTKLMQGLVWIHDYSGANPINFEEPLCSVMNSSLDDMARHADVVTLLCGDAMPSTLLESIDTISSLPVATISDTWQVPGKQLARTAPTQGAFGNAAYQAIHASDESVRLLQTHLIHEFKLRYLDSVCEYPTFASHKSAAERAFWSAQSKGDLVGQEYARFVSFVRLFYRW